MEYIFTEEEYIHSKLQLKAKKSWVHTDLHVYRHGGDENNKFTRKEPLNKT
jgi:hypothetical protein